MTFDPLHTRLCEEYGCEVPIGALAHTRDVIVAVTNAGGIGVYGGGTDPESLRADIRWIKERVGDRPFGIDFLMPASVVEGNQEDIEAAIPQEHREFVAGLKAEHGIPDPKLPPRHGGTFRGDMLQRARRAVEVLFEEEVPILVSGLGSPAFIVERAHAAGMKVWGLVGLPRQAKRQIEAGVDVVIAQGYDSGGHSGTVGTFTLVPEVVELARGSDTIVLAAGGVSSGKHLAAALAMGAAGVWTGTIWLATNECQYWKDSDINMQFRQRLIEANAEDPIQSRGMSGKPIRQLPSRFSDAWKQPEAPPTLEMPLQGMLVDSLLRGAQEAKMAEWLVQPAGQSVVGIHESKPAAQVVYDMADEALAMIERFQGES